MFNKKMAFGQDSMGQSEEINKFLKNTLFLKIKKFKNCNNLNNIHLDLIF